jgi:4'-phosphopantetheinyl transferase EntD
MIETILPTGVNSAEELGQPRDVFMFPEELAGIAKAVPRRRAEFATGRHCARLALADLGVPAAPIVRGEAGAPVWPDGVVGSITHCTGYTAAAVGRAEDVAALGIDAEPHGALPADVLDVVTLEEERAELAELAAARPGVCWDRLLFSAKESVYKAWFPVTGRWLGLKQAMVTIDAETQTFAARLLVPGPVAGGEPITQYTGRWLASDELILTSVTLPASCSPT